MKALLTILALTVVLTLGSQAQTPQFLDLYQKLYGESPFAPTAPPPAVQAPVVVFDRVGDTLFTSAGPIVLLNTGINSGSSFGPDAGLRPFPIK